MIMLAVNDGHDAGACLLKDGRLVLASAEERRVNQKNFAGIPVNSLGALFARTGIQPEEVDALALSSIVRTTVPTREPKRIYRILGWLSWLAKGELGTRAGRAVLSRLRKKQDLLRCLKALGVRDVPLLTYDHHTCHGACAYYHRPWDGEALVLTLDGAGDGYCARVFVGRDNALEPVAATPKYHSVPAHMYSAITAHLGLRPYEHEYKVMGMAPYGQLDGSYEVLRELFRVDGLTFRNTIGLPPTAFSSYYTRKLAGFRFDNISAACQKVFEDLVVEWVSNAVRRTGVRKLACAGGAFLNVKANMLLRELEDVESLYVYPAADDGGTVVGAAILGYLHLCEETGTAQLLDLPQHMYCGLAYSEDDVLPIVQRSGFPYVKPEKPAGEVARLLAEGKVVARFDGPEEWGPRALGNRSILADPRDLKVIRKLNFAIKHRDFWMPFAVSILEEDAHKYVKALSPRPYYMIEAFQTNPETVNDIVAGVHPFDQTVRPQIVNDLNPEYKRIIEEFKRLTGVGAVLNTSFNLHGYPIVGSPEVALDTFRHSELDALQIGPFLVTKGGSQR